MDCVGFLLKPILLLLLLKSRLELLNEGINSLRDDLESKKMSTDAVDDRADRS